jgi:hypothetical protein
MVTLYHGSQTIIERPEFGKGNPRNDYGLGFYCTENKELAKEWACLTKDGGFINKYTIDPLTLDILYLSKGRYTMLHWLAILVNNRTFRIANQLATQAKEYLLANFLLDISRFDAIVGHRADDSYFAFAMDFLNNAISLKQLGRAMYLGNLGEQFMLRSERAFKQLEFAKSEMVDGETYYIKRISRDLEAREQYLKNERSVASIADDLFMIDILRQEMKQNDTRLQREPSE